MTTLDAAVEAVEFLLADHKRVIAECERLKEALRQIAAHPEDAARIAWDELSK